MSQTLITALKTEDAILSRCIAAIIQYGLPVKEAAQRIWESLANQFEVDLLEALIDELTRTYANTSGRDIKELLKPTAKYCKGKNIPFSAEAAESVLTLEGLSKNLCQLQIWCRRLQLYWLQHAGNGLDSSPAVHA